MNMTVNNDINIYLNQNNDISSIIEYVDSFNNINTKKLFYRYNLCIDPICIKKAKYGVLQSYPIYCHTHKEEYMFDVVSKKCKYSGCITQPSFGWTFNKPEYCKKHSIDKMYNVKLKLCTSHNCTKKATYRLKPGIELSLDNKLELFLKFNSQPIFCRIHKTDNMVNIYKKIKM